MQNKFKVWLTENYSHNELADMANHGCSGGVGGMIYYADTEKLYRKFAHELHDILFEYKDVVGNFPDFVTDELGHFASFANSIVWLCAELTAQEITQGEYKEEEEDA